MTAGPGGSRPWEPRSGRTVPGQPGPGGSDGPDRPFAAALNRARTEHRALVLDGASGTELERRGADVSGDLWAAALLESDPGLVTAMHVAYLDAGAEVIESISYQATVPGLVAAGNPEDRARALLARSWDLVAQAASGRRTPDGRPVLAASSIGPYGAYLADGSEYTGDYPAGVDATHLREFHAERIEVLAAAGCRLFACETIPHAAEVAALVAVMREHPEAEWWLSLSIRTDAHGGITLADGTPLCRALAVLPASGSPGGPAAVGINCCPARLVAPVLAEVRATGHAGLAYPNSGETYDAATGTWSPPDSEHAGDTPPAGPVPTDEHPAGDGTDPAGGHSTHDAVDPVGFAAAAADWVGAGAAMIGGCCRTTPAVVRALAQRT
ncbi:homocysteine S-methyltransferase [Brevibacterium sp. CS2]|nr:homocysteine S-methyltransferase [Brevibacterium sp. CS2]